MQTHILWFRNDLRLHDHEALAALAPHVSLLLPVFIYEEKLFKKTPLTALARISPRRRQFLDETVQDLKKKLQKIGSDLLILRGQPESLLPVLAAATQASVIHAQKEYTYEEVASEKAVASQLTHCKLSFFEAQTLIAPSALPFDVQQLPNIFTEFRKKVELSCRIRRSWSSPIKLPPLPDLSSCHFLSKHQYCPQESLPHSPKAVLPFVGGETHALLRLKHYFWDTQHLSCYKETRNGLLGEAYSSKFSPYLALGALSPVYVYEEIQRFEKQILKNDSTYWLFFELLWRDYFKFVGMKYEQRIFYKNGLMAHKNPKTYKNSLKDFRDWCQGQCQQPFINANMRELAETGFMSNRGRQNVASYLVKDLKVDWRWGAEFFETMLLDYDTTSNWCNWQYVAGVGKDPREDRYFNIPRQAALYDPDGLYVQHWLD